MLDNTQTMGLMALGGVIAGAWSKVKLLFTRFVGLFIVTATYHNGTAITVADYFHTSLRRIRLGPVAISATYLFSRRLGRLTRIAYEVIDIGQSDLFFRGRVPVLCSFTNELTRVSFPRFLWSYRAILAESAAFEDRKSHMIGLNAPRYDSYIEVEGRDIDHKAGSQADAGSRNAQSPPGAVASVPGRMTYINVSPLLDHTWAEIGIPPSVPGSEIAKMAARPQVLAAYETARKWRESVNWYSEHDINWRLGLLLHGEPGNGKSLFARTLSRELNVPIYAFDLASMDNRDLGDRWNKNRSRGATVIYLFEDFDNVFHGRERVGQQDQGRGVLTFDRVLNLISNPESSHGILLIVTCNDVTKIDEALGRPLPEDPSRTTRPGRLDYAVEFARPDAEGRRKIATRILASYPEAVEALVGKGDGSSAAGFQELCRRYAIARFWGHDADAAAMIAEDIGVRGYACELLALPGRAGVNGCGASHH